MLVKHTSKTLSFSMGLFISFAPFGGIKMSLDEALISDMAWKAGFPSKFPHLHKSMKKWQRGSNVVFKDVCG